MSENSAGERRSSSGRPRKVLVIKLRALGDTVLMTAPLIALQKTYKDAEFHVAVMAPWGGVFDHFPGVSKIWTYERHKERTARAKALTRLGLKLRRERYDVVVNLHASPSSATLCFAIGARHRAIHFHGHRDKNRYSTVRIPGKGTLKPIIERDMDTVRALGIEVPEGSLPRIYLHPAESERAIERLQLQGFSGKILGIGLGSSRPTKSWAIERFAEVAVRWCRETGGTAVAFVAPEERERGLAFLKSVDEQLRLQIPELSGRAAVRARLGLEASLELRLLSAMLAQCKVFLGNDSGPRHLAVAVGVPTVTLFGPEHPFEWHPYPLDRHPRFFIEPLECRRDGDPGMPAWCGLDVCTAQAHRCMAMIGTDAVLAECLRVSA